MPYQRVPMDSLTHDFLPNEYLTEKDNPYYIRNQLTDSSIYRSLKAEEIEILVKNSNTAENWNKIFVTDNFNPYLIRGCEFLGMVRIGQLKEYYLDFHDLRLPVGLYNCVIKSCDIGNNVIMRNVHYISHYILEDECILFNIDEMITTNHAKFGVGIIKEGELENVRIWLELGNENGGRRVLPFTGMLSSDAYLWSKFRGNKKLMNKFLELTENVGDKRRGYYGKVGTKSVVKNCRIIKDTNIGPNSYIKGANKLKNLTILSNQEEPAQIGEGVELVNGIIGYGSRIFYGCKAVRFMTGRNTQLKYGARLINSYLGDNSTVSCCEILNNLIFPFHEQHHNNSFLIATTIMGQSNIAANATIGSNHNSRSPDGEIVANRGFWPGLCSNFKHNSKFASFVLVSNGNYIHELDIKFPFSLVSRNENENCLQIMPGYWFMYNMYAITRNGWKFKVRDKRVKKEQNIELDFLAPDTIQEILYAMDLLLPEIGRGLFKDKGMDPETAGKKELLNTAQEFIESDFQNYTIEEQKQIEDRLQVYINGMEHSQKKTKVIKAISGLQSYREMVFYYGIKNLKNHLLQQFPNKEQKNGEGKEGYLSLTTLLKNFTEKYEGKWWNIGGQIIYNSDLLVLIDDITSGKLSSWDKIHNRYDELWQNYSQQKIAHAVFSLEKMIGKSLTSLSKKEWKNIFIKGLDIQKKITRMTIRSREKDYSNDFRRMVYKDQEEMEAVLGKIDDNSFITYLKKKTIKFEEDVNFIINRL